MILQSAFIVCLFICTFLFLYLIILRKPMLTRILFILTAVCILLCSCQTDKSTKESSLDQVVVRLEKEPQRLNPMLYLLPEANTVMEHMYLSLCDYDPISGEWVPVLAIEMPQIRTTVNDEGSTEKVMEIEILPEAIWGDGSPVTAHDVVFTMKLTKLSGINAPAWKQLTQELKSIDIDESNPKKFTVTTIGDYFLTVDGFLSAEIFPSHIYDQEGRLGKYTYEDLRNMDDEVIVADSTLSDVAREFSSAKYSREPIIDGAGPYRLKQWEPGQFIVLERKENWWGGQYPNRPLLAANPDRIIYQIIADATVAITQLKNGEIDVISLAKIPSQSYLDLQQDLSITEQYSFHTPQLPRIYYLLLNNQDPRLADINVRKALAHSMDVDRIINQQEKGLGQKIAGPLGPSQSGYINSIPSPEYDIDLARKLLVEGGWKDIDGDGIVEKDGQELNLRFFITGSPLSTVISTLLKESALEAGINIELITKSGAAYRQENIIPGDYEITAQALTGEGRTDLYPSFHSEQIGVGGSNLAGYSDVEVDELIETIQYTDDEEERTKAYHAVQREIAEDQAVIFLYAPLEKFVVSKKFQPVISSKRPGFFVNAFKPS